jgi:hypothetical protein
MTKIVYNGSYGGFGLSEKAIQRYSDLAGLGLTYKKEEDRSWGNWYTPDGDRWAYNEISRTDPFLVQLVEELGEEANGLYARLDIMDLPKGTLYRIDEYDGMESVMTQDDYDWSVA